MRWPKVAFLHGRPGPHWAHGAFAKSIEAQFVYIDAWARWHDRSDRALIRYGKWFVNAWRFPYKQYDALLVEGPHAWPAFGAKYLGQRPCFSLADNETAYFLWSNFLGPWTRRGLIKSIGTYHGLLIVGKMQARLMKELLRDKMPPYWIVYNGVPEKKLEGSSTALANKKLRILLIAHGPSGWRTWYKGLDLWMETLEKLSYKLSGVEGWVVGQWQEEEIQRLLRLYPKAPVQFLGAMQDVTQVVKEANLYLHLGRGEAWGLAVLEAMAMGVPAIVSEYTGAAEVVEQVWTEGVVPLSADLAAEAVLRYFSLSEAERRALSEKGQTLIREKYRFSQAIETFQAAFSEALKVVGLR